LNASNLETNKLRQAGIGIENTTNQGILDHQPTAFSLEDRTKESSIRSSDASARASDSSVLSDRVRDAYTKAQTGNIGREVAEKGKAREAAAALYAAARNPDFSANGKLDQAKVFDAVVASGVNPMDLYGASATYDVVSGRNDAKATAALDAAFAKEKEKIDYEQSVKNLAKSRDDAKTALQAAQDTDTSWLTGNFVGQDDEKLAGDAAIAAAFATRVKSPSGKEVGFSPSDISRFVAESSSGGDLDVTKFNTRLAREATSLKEKSNPGSASGGW
jgi:hypothetical protein